MVRENPRVPGMENQMLPTQMVEPIAPQIHDSEEIQYHTNGNDAIVNLTGNSTDIVTPLH